jgi:hypothetical protein
MPYILLGEPAYGKYRNELENYGFSPVALPADKRLNLACAHTWLPEGRWTDIFTDRIYRGGQWVRMYRDLDSIPALAREGAIVPMYRSGETNDLSLEQPLDIHIWRGNGEFALYEDDGETKDPRHALTKITVAETGDSLAFRLQAAEGNPEILPNSRSVRLIFRDIAEAELWINGQTARFHPAGILLEVKPRQDILVELKRVIPLANPPKAQLQTDLLTRVQGEIIWKNAVLGSDKKMPKFIRQALAELDALVY